MVNLLVGFTVITILLYFGGIILYGIMVKSGISPLLIKISFVALLIGAIYEIVKKDFFINNHIDIMYKCFLNITGRF